jgi:hypothetical protein
MLSVCKRLLLQRILLQRMLMSCYYWASHSICSIPPAIALTPACRYSSPQ